MSERDKMAGRVGRGVAWVGLASSLVGVLDIAAFGIVVATGWVDIKSLGAAWVVIPYFRVFDLATDMGLAAAVVQRDDHSPERISTVFWLNSAMSVTLCALLLFVVGPFASWYFDEPILAGLLALYSTKLIWQNVYFIPYALMKREFRFKELSVLRVIANLAEFAGKIGFAAAGFGVWCFVAGPLCRVAITGLGTQWLYPWRPSLSFHWRGTLDWLAFGFRSTGHKILFFFYSNVDYWVVTSVFGKTANGLYAAAYTLVLQPARALSDVADSVSFPTFSRLRHHPSELGEQLVAFSRLNSVIVLAVLGIVFVGAEEILSILSLAKKDDYVVAAPAVRILSIVGALRALSFVFPSFLDGIGKPYLTLRYSLVAAVLLPASFMTASTLANELNYLSVAWAWAAGYPLAFAVLIWMVFAQVDMRLSAFVRRVVGIFLCAGLALPAAFAVKIFGEELPFWARLGALAAIYALVFFFLLARLQGITPRSIRASIEK